MNKKSVLFIVGCMFFGIMIGTILVNILNHYAPVILQCLALDTYNVQALDLNQRKHMILYTIQKRTIQYGIMIFLLVFIQPLIAFCCIATIVGIVFGSLLSVEVIRLGVKGIILAITCFLPQYIFFIYSYALLLRMNMNVNFEKNWL